MMSMMHKQPATPLVILTDLDGTLLDHNTYSTDPARATLKFIREHHFPLVFNTSKTRPEVKLLRNQMDNRHPYVCENGSAVYLPISETETRTEILGTDYSSILKVLNQLRKDGFRFRGFNDMPASEVSALTGLSLDDASMAKKREATEPMLWQGKEEDVEAFRTALSHHNLRLLKGGRFYHVMGKADKADGLNFLKEHYEKLWQQTPVMIALGDGENDLAMLEAADYPIVIPGKNNCLKPEHPQAITAEYPGPKGWNQSLLPLLEKLIKEFSGG